ncbi:MAG TPA: ABC transporter substrate-binding protein, partial [Anaerolineales bacterium]
MSKKNEQIARKIALRIFPVLLVFTMILAACGAPAATEAPAPTEEAATEPAAPTEPAAATEPPAATEPAAATEPPTVEPSGPIKIGQLSDLTSTFTPWGLNVRDGMALAAQEINDAGGVNGRMIEIVVQDSENDG